MKGRKKAREGRMGGNGVREVRNVGTKRGVSTCEKILYPPY